MTWNLVSQSFRLLRNDKKLLVFPILSAIGAAALALPFLLALFGMRPAGGLHWGSNTWLFVFLWYCGASFITIFFNCALAACVQLHFAGQDPTLGDGLRRAASRVHTILLWSLVSATVGQIARAVETRAGWTGRLIIGTVRGKRVPAEVAAASPPPRRSLPVRAGPRQREPWACLARNRIYYPERPKEGTGHGTSSGHVPRPGD